MRTKNMLVLLGLISVFASNVQAQDEAVIRGLFQDAIEAMGGEAYLNVKDMTSEGQFFQFNRDGDNSGLIKYVDYTRLPDKSRHEAGNKRGIRKFPSSISRKMRVGSWKGRKELARQSRKKCGVSEVW